MANCDEFGFKPKKLEGEEKAFWKLLPKLLTAAQGKDADAQVAAEMADKMLRENPWGYIPPWIERQFPGTGAKYYNPPVNIERHEGIGYKIDVPTKEITIRTSDKVKKAIELLWLAGTVFPAIPEPVLLRILGWSPSGWRWAWEKGESAKGSGIYGGIGARGYNRRRWKGRDKTKPMTKHGHVETPTYMILPVPVKGKRIDEDTGEVAGGWIPHFSGLPETVKKTNFRKTKNEDGTVTYTLKN